MNPYEISRINGELRRLDRTKVNTCPFEDLMNRVNYLETTNNDLVQRVRRLEDEVQRLYNEAKIERSRSETLSNYMQAVGIVLQNYRNNEYGPDSHYVDLLVEIQTAFQNSWPEGDPEI